MAQAITCAIAPVLTVIDGQATTLSTDVARHFGKRHDHVLRDIENLRAQVGERCLPNFGEASVEVAQPNGGTTTYKAYRLTRDGFTLLAMGFTGKRALQFKLAYIDAFNQMEAALIAQSQPPATLSTEQAYQIKKAVEAKCMGNSAKFRTLYTRLYDAFHVSRYRDIAASDFERAIAFIEQWQPPRGFDPAITCDNPQPQPPVVPANPFGERMRWEIVDEGDGNIRCRLLDSSHKLIQYERLPGIIRDPENGLPFTLIRDLLDACADRLERFIINGNETCKLLRTQLRQRGLN